MRLEPLYYLFIYNTYVLNRVYTATSTATCTTMMKAPTFILIYIYIIYFILFKWCISIQWSGVCRTLWGSVKYWKFVLFQGVPIIGEHMLRFPWGVRDRITLPFDVILVTTTLFSMVEDGLDFVYFFSFYQFRWWFWEILSIGLVFSVRFKECRMENIVNSPWGR